MAMAKLSNKRFKLGGRSYFVDGATKCQIGSAGEKRSPLGKPKNLDIHNTINPEKIGSLSREIIEIELDVKKKTAYEALLPLVLPGLPLPIPVDVRQLGGKVTEGSLKLMRLWADERALTQAANDSPRLLNDLIDWGRDARLVNEIFVVVEAKLAEKFMSAQSLKIGASIDGLIGIQVGGDGRRAGRIDITLSRGSVFAYQLADIVWDAKAKKKRKYIKRLNDDQYGTG